jgi:hypothetical protein
METSINHKKRFVILLPEWDVAGIDAHGGTGMKESL